MAIEKSKYLRYIIYIIVFLNFFSSMCGIVGKLNFNPQKQISSQLIQEMAKTLSHRGPDGQGFYFKNNIGLGHQRLKIIDLSENAKQPMANEDQTCWIVFNGEIYNFQDLRKDLIKKGHQFISSSDTEVILHLYEDYGENCLQYLRGMFAFAIWDEKKEKLFLARDRLGKKPLKYCLGPDFFIFASELKAILKDPKVKKEPDFQALNHYLTFQYAPSPLTGFKNIKKLAPAHYLICQQGKIEITRYWQLDFSKKLDLSEKEWQRKILEKLEEAVKIRMISDVPLGAFLSGGIDSSAVVALMSRFSSQPVKTFTIGFQESGYNEIPFARKIAQKFKTEHQEFIVKPDAINILPKLAYFYEEPYADSSAVPCFYLAELTKKYVTVALNGDGGDENFAGYKRHQALKIFYFLAKFPKFSLPLIKELLVLSVKLALPKTSQIKLINFFKKLGQSPEKAYLQIISYFNEEEKEKIYTDSFRKEIETINSSAPLSFERQDEASFEIVKEKFAQAGPVDFLDKVFFLDIVLSLPEDLLVKMDIATMAHGLESRSPLLDQELLELTAQLPLSLKLKGLNKKYIFKQILKDFLPQEILERKKTGFGLPIENWFRSDLKDYAYQILLGKKFLSREIFKKEGIEEILDKHCSGKENLAFQIWALLFLEYWFQQYFD